MNRRCRFPTILLAGISALFPPATVAQLEGSFSLSKPTYLAGEPIFLTFTVKNTGSEPLLIRTADPLSFCGGYRFELQGARDRHGLPCMGGVGGSCASSGATLLPGAIHTDRILLNRRFDLRQPGTYLLHVTYTLHYGTASEGWSMLELNGLDQEFQDQLQIVIEPSQPSDLRSEFAQYERDLHAHHWSSQLEAAQVIAYLAPQFVEPAILSMLQDPELQGYGVEGLRNLGTASAHRALADVVRHIPHGDALRDLGEIGDADDIPALLAAARANAPDRSDRELAIESIGRVGGAAAVPALETELADPSLDTRQDAVRAMYLTGSRAAIPVLINLLRSPEWRVSGTAEFGLEVLTHRSAADTTEMKPPPPDTYRRWLRWWNTQGQSTPTYKPDQCGKIEPLPPF